MLEEKGDLFKINADVICITTNGFLKSNGEAVMGRGCAFTAKKKYPIFPKVLGNKIKSDGNRVFKIFTRDKRTYVSFPVKPEYSISDGSNFVSHSSGYPVGAKIPGFHCKADINIIIESAHQLVDLADANPQWKRILIPRPGCGNGELKWETVRNSLSEILDDRFIVVSFPDER